MENNIKNLKFAPNSFAFISYLHSDTAKVKQFLYLFDRECIRYWYDGYIDVATEWESTINNHLDECEVFVSFISNGVEQRSEVVREIERALQLEKKIIMIFLEKVPLDVFSDELRKKIGKSQFIELRKFGGITEGLVRALLNNRVWPSKVVDDSKRESMGLIPWKDKKENSKELKNAVQYLETVKEKKNPYIYQKAEPKLDGVEEVYGNKKRKIKFYKVNKNEINPDAVYPICFDNQWCPVSVFESDDFKLRGFNDPNVTELIQKAQLKELYRSLIHNWQLIVNRASIYNTKIFIKWYENKDQEFVSLLSDGSIVIYLMKENVPWKEEKNDKNGYDIKGNTDKLKEICASTPLYCLKMDWENETENNIRISKSLGYKFQEVCLTTYDDYYRVKTLRNIFRIEKPGDKISFIDLWKRIQNDVINRDRGVFDEHKVYSREKFYKKFVVAEGTSVPECRISSDKPFAKEIKQIIDFYYSINLPNALNIRPLLPSDSPFKNFFITEGRPAGMLRETTFEELIYAVKVFSDDFLKELSCIENEEEVNLSFITSVRKLPEWKTYMRTVDGSKKQASINEINFNEIISVYSSYSDLVNAVEKADFAGKIKWKKQKGLTVIYRIDSDEIVTIYENTEEGNKKPEYSFYARKAADSKSDIRETLTIDYILGDIRNEKVRESCMFTELRLFEGLITTAGSSTFDKLLEEISMKGNKIDDPKY